MEPVFKSKVQENSVHIYMVYPPYPPLTIDKTYATMDECVGCMLYYRAQWIMHLYDRFYKKAAPKSLYREKLWNIGYAGHKQLTTKHDWHIQVVAILLKNEEEIKGCIPSVVYPVHEVAMEQFNFIMNECRKYKDIYVRYQKSKELRPAAARVA